MNLHLLFTKSFYNSIMCMNLKKLLTIINTQNVTYICIIICKLKTLISKVEFHISIINASIINFS